MKKYLLYFLILLNLLLWFSVVETPKDTLSVIACDVGQGDAFLITNASDQILIDGGANNKVLECLSKHLPYWDKQIELVVLTHPQKDHYYGLIEVFKNYEVKSYLKSEANVGNDSYQLLQNAIGGMKVNVINADTETNLRLGLMSLDILWPDGFENIDDRDLNNYSVSFLFRYKDFSAVFTGDAGEYVLNQLVEKGNLSDVDYLKVPHHGSKNGLTESFLTAVSPEVSVISCGKNNSYGHPHKEVLDMLERARSAVYRTDEKGEMVLFSDGSKWWVE